MPGRKRKFNVRFSPKRIKKIMQKDTEVGRISTAVPVIISRALEMFLKSLLTKTCLITQSMRSAVVSAAHMKQCIESEKLFHFLREQVDQSMSTGPHGDNRGIDMWPLYRDKKEVSSEKTCVVEKLTADNDSSSSEAELIICL